MKRKKSGFKCGEYFSIFSLKFDDFFQKKCAYCDIIFSFNYHYFFPFWQNFASQKTLMKCRRKWGFFVLGGGGGGGVFLWFVLKNGYFDLK